MQQAQPDMEPAATAAAVGAGHWQRCIAAAGVNKVAGSTNYLGAHCEGVCSRYWWYLASMPALETLWRLYVLGLGRGWGTRGWGGRCNLADGGVAMATISTTGACAFSVFLSLTRH
jgi:hypothetical protein